MGGGRGRAWTVGYWVVISSAQRVRRESNQDTISSVTMAEYFEVSLWKLFDENSIMKGHNICFLVQFRLPCHSKA